MIALFTASAAGTHSTPARESRTQEREPARQSAILLAVISGAAIALLVLSVLAIVATLLTLRDTAIADARRRVEDYAYLVAEQSARTLQAVDLTLQGIVDYWAARGPNIGPADRDFNAFLQERLVAIPFVRTMFLVDENGRVTHDIYGPLASSADEAIWQSAKTAAPALTIGPPATSAAGVPLVRVARRLPLADDEFGGLVIALLDPNHFLRLYGRLDIGAEGAVALYLRDGTLVLRNPRLRGRNESTPPVQPPFLDLLPQSNAGLYEYGDQDGLVRITGYHAVDTYPVVTTVGMSRTDALATWERTLVLASAIWLLFAGAVLAFARLLFRHLRERQRHEIAMRDLAKFPSEDPHPVLRVGRSGAIRYANRSAIALAHGIERADGGVSERWAALLSNAAHAEHRESIDFESFGRTIHFSVVPVPQAAYVNLYGTDITDRRRQEQELLRINRALSALAAANRAVVASTSRSSLLGAVCSALVDSAGYAFVWIGEASGDIDIQPRAAHAHGIGPLTLTEEPGTSGGSALARASLGVQKFQRTHDPVDQAIPAHWRKLLGGLDLRSAVAVPITVGTQTMLSLVLADSDANAFPRSEVAVLDTLAQDIGYGLLVVDSVQKYSMAESGRVAALERLEAALVDAVTALSATVEKRDPYTAGHQQRVSDLAATIALQLGMSTNQIKGVRLGSLMHDIGKIGIPAEILAKPSKLSAVDREFINTHPQVGFEIIHHLNFDWPLARIVMEHHERLDGSGYPRGLKGDEICLEARIVGVADVVEAMVSHRPYRPALGLEAALREITAHRGTRFDAKVVDACIKILREGIFSFADPPPP